MPVAPIFVGSKPRFAACERTTRTARCRSSHADWWIGSPFGRGVRYVTSATVMPASTSLSMAGCRRAASQQELKPPPETVMTQRSVLRSGLGAYQSMYGRRKSSALNPEAAFSPVFAAIWCGWASGIFPSGQMYSRSHDLADGVSGPNDSPQYPAIAASAPAATTTAPNLILIFSPTFMKRSIPNSTAGRPRTARACETAALHAPCPECRRIACFAADIFIERGGISAK